MNKKHLSIALSSLLALPLLAPIGSVPKAVAEEADQDVVIVYKNADGKEAAIEQSEEIQHEFKNVPAVAATVSAEDLRDLVDNPDIDYIERNVTFQLTDLETASTTPAANLNEASNWNYKKTAPDTMWKQGFTGKGVKVAVVDSGISAHPELNIAGGISTVGSENSTNYADDNGHGTHVAGIIAADSGNGRVAGVAPGVSLYAVKSLGANGKGTLVDVLEGLDWAIQNKMDIINLSLGGDSDAQSLHDMVDKAYNQGILVVASAGNSGTASNTDQDTVGYPAKYSSVISVAAVDQSLNRSEFSSTGPKVDVAAPGSEIFSTYPAGLNGSTGYATMSGTSQAAPHVAGELALLKEKNPSASAANLRGLLNSYAVDLGAPGRDNLYGNGFITFSDRKDSTAPAEVSDAKVAAATTDSLTLNWTSPSDSDFKEVRVYSGTDTTFTTVTQSTYQALNLSPDTAYAFRLTTVDTADNESQGVKVSGRTAAPAASNTPDPSESPSSGGTPVSTSPVQSEPVQSTPAPSIPVVTTPAPSGGSAQIPSG
ncbi:S8 family peptidase, partial [Saccharibacillus sacchari]